MNGPRSKKVAQVGNNGCEVMSDSVWSEGET